MFTGFSQKSTEFLWGIRFNNNREWFLENKQTYLDAIQKPLKELADAVWSCLTEKNNLDISYRVTRIYRDARRVRSGSLYKDSLWFSLEKEHENWQATPVFFFEILPEGYMYGLGYYQATAETMKKFRAQLDADPDAFLRIASELTTENIFELTGDEYRRKKAEKEGLLGAWYNRKTLALIAERKGHEKLYSKNFVKTLCDDFQTLMPLYRFLWSLENDEQEGATI